jgi:hypothetical protein
LGSLALVVAAAAGVLLRGPCPEIELIITIVASQNNFVLKLQKAWLLLGEEAPESGVKATLLAPLLDLGVRFPLSCCLISEELAVERRDD